jgi:hypothetical protein
MGMARARKDAFKQEHPNCIFCGGSTPMTTIEHCPPRAMFQNRVWPEGFEFAACDKCNHGSADDDLIVAMLARIDPFEGASRDDGKFVKLISSVHQQHPNLLHEMFPSPNEARRINEKLGLRPPSGGTQQDTGIAKIPERMSSAVGVFASKLAKAIYYQSTGEIFPRNGELGFKWAANADLVATGRYRIFDAFSEISGIAPRLKRGQTLLNDQFEYKFSMSDTNDLFAIQARFGAGFALILIGSTVPSRLNNYCRDLAEKTGKPNPFTFLP